MSDEAKYAAELPLNVEPKALKLGDRQIIGLHMQLGHMHPEGHGSFDLNLHINGLCMWIRSPKGNYYQVNHKDLWEAAVTAIIEHEKDA